MEISRRASVISCKSRQHVALGRDEGGRLLVMLSCAIFSRHGICRAFAFVTAIFAGLTIRLTSRQLAIGGRCRLLISRVATKNYKGRSVFAPSLCSRCCRPSGHHYFIMPSFRMTRGGGCGRLSASHLSFYSFSVGGHR